MSERTTDALQRVNTQLAAIAGAVDGMRKAADQRFAELTDRVEEIESRRSLPGLPASPRSAKAAETEHVKRFSDWVRKPFDAQRQLALAEFEAKEFGRKDVTVGTPASGGYAVPEEISREIERLELKISPVRSLVKVVTAGTSDYKELVSTRGTTAGWVGESGSRLETDTSQLRERAPTHGELYAYPQCSEWSLDDMFFNVAEWIAAEVADAFATQEADAILRGNGSNKPTGMLNTTPTTAPDFSSPPRGAAVYQYIASASTVSPAVAEIVPDRLIDLVYTLNARYRAGASWVMNSTSAGAIAKMKDSQGRFIWLESLRDGEPARLLGHPVHIIESMDDIGTNAFPVAFGNFKRAYVLVDRPQGIRITTDANITRPGFVRFYCRRRQGGCVLNNDAAKWLRTTLS